MPGVLISYRREDTVWITGRIFDRLESHFGKNNVFMDVDNIPEGVDFREHIKVSLGRCDALIAVIGPKWIGDRPGGRARIWDEDDWVRLEIESALRMPIPVIPVLIDRTPMPRPDQLPESLHPLVFLQAAQMDTQRDFNTHIERLIRRLDELVTSSELEGDNGVSPNTRSPRITGNGKRSKLNFEEHVESTQPGVWGRRPTRIALLLVSVIYGSTSHFLGCHK
jgi:hypothetical protein